MTSQLTDQAAKFIETLISVNPPPDEIWLIGSRANGKATDTSDTDLLVFGSREFAAALKNQVPAPSNIDCLIVIDGDNYQDPWQQKSGSLAKLKWQKVDDSNAEYVGIKWAPDEESSEEFRADMGNFIYLNEHGIRIFPAGAFKPKPFCGSA